MLAGLLLVGIMATQERARLFRLSGGSLPGRRARGCFPLGGVVGGGGGSGGALPYPTYYHLHCTVASHSLLLSLSLPSSPSQHSHIEK